MYRNCVNYRTIMHSYHPCGAEERPASLPNGASVPLCPQAAVNCSGSLDLPHLHQSWGLVDMYGDGGPP